MKAIIICDFDGTITLEDVCHEILVEFNQRDWQSIGMSYDADRLSHMQMNALFVEQLNCEPEKLKAFLLNKIRIREGFYDFQKHCRAENLGFVIISGGWNIYIDTVLQNMEISFLRHEKLFLPVESKFVPVICNQVDFENGHYHFTSYVLESQKCTPDKRAVANYLKDKFKLPIICIGDSSTDHDVAKIADKVFSTGALTDYCNENGINCHPFTTFIEIQSLLFPYVAGLPNTVVSGNIRTTKTVLDRRPH